MKSTTVDRHNLKAHRKLKAKIDSQTTAQLLAHHAAIDAMPKSDLAPEHRYVSALMSEVIIARLGISGTVNRIFEAADARHDYTITFHDAILQAMVLTGQDA